MLPDDAAEVFRVRPEDFVAARDALVGRLRDAGREDDAAAVKALRKPTLVVWALNQVAVRAPEDVHALLDAGRELRAAQQAALTSGDPERLRAATTERRRSVAGLVTVAIDALAEAGSGTAAQSDQIRTALESASIDPPSGALLETGTFERPPAEPAGFGDVFALAEIPGGREEQTAPSTDLRSLKTEVTRLRREREKAERAAATRRAAVEALARERDDLRGRLNEVEAAYAEALHEAHTRETEAKRTGKALAKAETALERHRPG